MTTDTLALARQQLLAPAGLGEDALHRTLSCLLGHAIDGGDLYFQQRRAESWGLEDGQVKNASHAIQQGVGVRATSGEKTGFAYSDEIVLPALLEAATAARASLGMAAVLACRSGVPPNGRRFTNRSIRWKRCRPTPRSACWKRWTPRRVVRTRA